MELFDDLILPDKIRSLTKTADSFFEKYLIDKDSPDSYFKSDSIFSSLYLNDPTFKSSFNCIISTYNKMFSLIKHVDDSYFNNQSSGNIFFPDQVKFYEFFSPSSQRYKSYKPPKKEDYMSFKIQLEMWINGVRKITKNDSVVKTEFRDQKISASPVSTSIQTPAKKVDMLETQLFNPKNDVLEKAMNKYKTPVSDKTTSSPSTGGWTPEL